MIDCKIVYGLTFCVMNKCSTIDSSLKIQKENLKTTTYTKIYKSHEYFTSTI